jgi:hypothetical protein
VDGTDDFLEIGLDLAQEPLGILVIEPGHQCHHAQEQQDENQHHFGLKPHVAPI